jgi:hypothetical protein
MPCPSLLTERGAEIQVEFSVGSLLRDLVLRRQSAVGEVHLEPHTRECMLP